MNDGAKDLDPREADDITLDGEKKTQETIEEATEAEAVTETVEAAETTETYQTTETAETVETAETTEITEAVEFAELLSEKPIFDKQKEKSNFSRIGFGFVIFSGVSLLVSLVIQIVVMVVSEEFYRSHLFLNLLTPVSMYLFALPVLISFLKKSKPEPPKKKSIGLGEWMLYLLVGFGLMYIGAFIGNGVMAALSSLIGYDYSNALNSVIDGGNIWVTAIFMVIVAPIGEEFVFRKLLIDRTGKYGCFISALLSGLIFGLMHGNLYQFFYATMLGFVLGYLYYNTGKIFYTITIHAVINFFGSVVSTLLSDAIANIDTSVATTPEQIVEFLAENGLGLIFISLFDVFIYGAMICAIVLPIVFRKRLKFAKGEVQIPKGQGFSTVFLNAGMICMIIFYIVEIAMTLLPL